MEDSDGCHNSLCTAAVSGEWLHTESILTGFYCVSRWLFVSFGASLQRLNNLGTSAWERACRNCKKGGTDLNVQCGPCSLIYNFYVGRG